MMLVFLMWAHSDRIGARSGGWLEAVRTSSFETLVRPAGPGPAAPAAAGPATPAAAAPPSDAAQAARAPGQAAGAAVPGQAAAAVPARAADRGPGGTIDDDEHLDAYNAYLARLNQSGHGPAR